LPPFSLIGTPQAEESGTWPTGQWSISGLPKYGQIQAKKASRIRSF
jgi:hypothetical protein